MSVGVFTRNKRVTFVEKLPGEVGDGTPYPLKVTLTQLAEILFRVKDAWFIGGEFIGSNSFPGYTASYRVTASTTAPSQRASADSAYIFQTRGYCAESATLSAFSDPYLDAEYDNGAGTMFRDISDNERALWLPVDDPAEGPYWNNPPTLVTAFSMVQTTALPPPSSSDYFQSEYLDYFLPVPNPTGTYASVTFGSELAWVDTNGSGNPLDPLNELYLKMEFQAGLDSSGGGGGFEIIVGTNIDNVESYFATPVEVCRYIIRLAPLTVGGSPVDISCPVYSDTTNWETTSASDFIHKAQKWMPYAKDSPAVPVWDEDTGVLL